MHDGLAPIENSLCSCGNSRYLVFIIFFRSCEIGLLPSVSFPCNNGALLSRLRFAARNTSVIMRKSGCSIFFKSLDGIGTAIFVVRIYPLCHCYVWKAGDVGGLPTGSVDMGDIVHYYFVLGFEKYTILSIYFICAISGIDEFTGFEKVFVT